MGSPAAASSLSMLLNFYADGKDSISPHADNEPSLRADAPVLVYSFGGPRDFVMTPFKGGAAENSGTLSIALRGGDFLAMGGACQREFQHAVPKRAHAAPRVSVTVRAHTH